jgi:NAD(P)-dependent dehydrogenase (short-subunit alcohol dehydrogenase family)
MKTLNDIGPLVMNNTNLKKDTLDGEVAVITGGAGNVGLGTARSLAWLGAKVVIPDINPDYGEAAEELINKENKSGTALFVQTDVSSESSMKNMAKKAFDTFGKVDILVNNAMDMSLGATILGTTIQQLDRQYEISTRGALIGIQLFVPGMQERHHGVITYMSTAFRYPIGPSNYCAIKSATTSVIMSLAAELGDVKDTGIAVFTFLPAGVNFPRSAKPSSLDESSRPMRNMPGYEGMVPPEHGGAALAYCITRAAELHGSGVTITQAFRQMDWPYPKPETIRNSDYQRIDDHALSLVFSIMGQGFPDPKIPLDPINRKEPEPNST